MTNPAVRIEPKASMIKGAWADSSGHSRSRPLILIQQIGPVLIRYRLTLIIISILIFPAEMMVRRTLAREYYFLTLNNLRLVAFTSVELGARYLPADPSLAVHMADAYARRHGIARAEIVFTGLSSNGRVLTISFNRKIPLYMVLLTAGGFPSRALTVTASARQRSVPRSSSANRIFSSTEYHPPVFTRW